MNGSARAGATADAGVLIPVLAAVMVLVVMREAMATMAIAGLTVVTTRQVQIPPAPAPVPVPAHGRRGQAGAAAAGHPRAGP